jgi:hypothetical protein
VNILRVIKAARISAMLQLQIEPADLFRVFPAFALSDATPQTGPMERDATTDCSWPNCVRSSPICGAGRTIRVCADYLRSTGVLPVTPYADDFAPTAAVRLSSSRTAAALLGIRFLKRKSSTASNSSGSSMI